MRRPARKKPLDPETAADPKAAHAAAIALLARRDHSTQDIDRKLRQRGYSQLAITAAIANLAQSKLLSDVRFSENLVVYRARRGQGPARIRNELRRSGVDVEIVEGALKSEGQAPDFLTLARAARVRKFGLTLPTDRKERARQARFLQYRGFSTDHIRAVLEGAPDDESDLDPGGDPDPT
jgi:regulatory protein